MERMTWEEGRLGCDGAGRLVWGRWLLTVRVPSLSRSGMAVVDILGWRVVDGLGDMVKMRSICAFGLLPGCSWESFGGGGRGGREDKLIGGDWKRYKFLSWKMTSFLHHYLNLHNRMMS